MAVMYTAHFGLRENPFLNVPDPSFFYLSELHREALTHLRYGISSDGCFILLTGDDGTGKTLVCRALLEQLPDTTDIALIANSRLTFLELLRTICAELEITSAEGETDRTFFLDSLKDYLHAAHAGGRNTVLLIDEAQNLEPDLLHELSLLTKLEIDGRKLLKIVLVGQAELRQNLEQNGVGRISEQITSRYHLLPLECEDVFAYIRHRLAVAGGAGKLFSEAALFRVWELSQGVPRLINTLCDRALLRACEEEKHLITEASVEQAVRELAGEQGERRGKGGLAILPLLLFLLLVLFLFVSFFPREASPPPLLEAVEVRAVERGGESIPVPALFLLSSLSVVFELQEAGTSLIEQEEREAAPVKPELQKRRRAMIRIAPLRIYE